MDGKIGTGPKFVSVGGSGAALQLVPPFGFEGVTMRTFPLRASLPKLTKFVDSYLNIIPPEVGYFRPFLPYVYLMIINYGKMAVEAANLGWIAQNEIAFSIGLEWYKKVDGVLKFQDFAYVSPFIYVDNDLSMTTGREVYGWPKSLVSLTPEISSWMENPRKGPRLATVSAMVFPELYAGARQELRPLLQIEQAPVPSFTQVPPDLTSPIYPWNSIPNAIRGSAAMLGDLGGILGGLGVTRAQPGASPRSFADMAALLAKNLNPYNPNLYFNTVNLKQFRDSGVQGAFCYQSVTNAPMSLMKFNAGGMLGDVAMMMGDASGGYRILMHKWPTQPIVDSLGLEVAREWDGDGTRVAELEPVCPLWLDVDMQYARGESLAWRARGQPWMVPGKGPGAAPVPAVAVKVAAAAAPSTMAGAIPVPAAAAAKATATAAVEAEPCAPLPPLPSQFNTALGTSLDLTGPFDFPSTTLRVLPLLADPEKLQAYCDGLLNNELGAAGQYFESWGRHVYLVATSYEEMSSDSNNVGSWADNDVVFYVPVRWYRMVDGKKELRMVALLPVFAFADGVTVAVTRSEVTGIPTQKAEIVSPPDSWMDDSGPSHATANKLLTVSAQVLPVMGMGQPTSERTLIEISEQDDVLPYNDDVRWRFVAEGWGKRLLADLGERTEYKKKRAGELDDARALAAGLLTGQMPFSILTLKQFRDAQRPSDACYQSLSEIDRTIQRVYDLREIESRVIVRIHRYANRPIMESLGLLSKWTDFSGAAPVDCFQAMRPFWMKVAMREELGCRVLWRAGTQEWIEEDHLTNETSVFATDPARRFRPDVGRGLVAQIDQGRPQRLHDHVATWKAGVKSEAEHVSAAQARAAVEVLGPQMAIESILSNEWEHWGNPYWYRTYSEMKRRLEDATVGVTGKQAVKKQLDTAKDTTEHFLDFATPGRPEVLDEQKNIFDAGDEICRLLGLVEDADDQMEDALEKLLDAEAFTTECTRIIRGLEPEEENLNKAFGDVKMPKRTAQARKNGNPLAPLVAVARAGWERGKEAGLLRFSRAAQPPEIFLRRDSLGTETDRRMPREHAYGENHQWYVGPSAAAEVQIPVHEGHLAVDEAAPAGATAADAKPAAAPAAKRAKAEKAEKPATTGNRSKSTSRSRPAASKKADG